MNKETSTVNMIYTSYLSRKDNKVAMILYAMQRNIPLPSIAHYYRSSVEEIQALLDESPYGYVREEGPRLYAGLKEAAASE